MSEQEREYWSGRWSEGRTGWHEAEVNAALLAHYAAVLSGRGQGDVARGRVLVPLCGKSVDLAWLGEQGHDVVGVEFVEEAARGYFAERGESPHESRVGPCLMLTHGRVSIVVSDVLTIDRATLGTFELLYDRAALVALSPELRERYYGVIAGLMAPAAKGLVITFQYDETQRSGPPFSVAADELTRGWPRAVIEEVGRSVQESRGSNPAPLPEHSYRVTFP